MSVRMASPRSTICAVFSPVIVILRSPDTATVETTSGVQVATIAVRRLPAGRFVASWRGTTRGGKFLVYGGMYAVRFRATNELGAVELVSPAFRVIRAAPVPVKKHKPKG